MLPWLQFRWNGLCLLVTALGALLLFLYGFFPLKYHSGKMGHMDDLPNFIDGVSIDGHEVYNPGEHSVILMVIDGLRYDFVTEEYMPYTGQMLKNKSACIYVSLAEPPTVTMPRIKSPERKKEKAQWRRTINFWRDIFAMMTGSVSTFADVALNFGAPAVRGDSVLRSAHSRGRRSVLYGDDTWLRLFPGLWAEADGTTSFYVTDYTEVDNNVTRHLDKILTPDENKKPKFDFLVLHYLGLDHIGHLEGARSPKINPKLIEMDAVVKKIYTAMQKWDRTGVLLICGDHGMRDAGGHGGSTPAEVLVPLVVTKSDDFFCPHQLNDSKVVSGGTVAQTDLAPTIAWLLNAPIPGESAGRVLPALLPRDTRQHLYVLHVLAAHVAQLPSLSNDTEFYKQFERAQKHFAQYLSTNQQTAAKIAKDFYEESLAEMAKIFTESVVNFDMFSIVVAVILLYSLGISLLCITMYSMQPESSRKYSESHHQRKSAGLFLAFLIMLALCTSALIISCFISESKSRFCSFDDLWTLAFVFTATTFAAVHFIIKAGIENTNDTAAFKDLNAIDYLLLCGTILHAWSFFGTSFIEEEHMTWYFLWNTLMFFVLMRNIVFVILFFGKVFANSTEIKDKTELASRILSIGIDILPKWICLIGLHRFLRTMNQTGDRWLFLPDTADWLTEPQNKIYLESIAVFSIVGTSALCIRNLKHTNNSKYVQTILTVLGTGCILAYKYVVGAIGDGTEFPEISFWDHVHVVNVFWVIIACQFIFELLTYIGVFKSCTENANNDRKFTYHKIKAKVEDFVYDPCVEEPWNLDEVKLNLTRSLLHLMLNSMMLTILILMRPHNMIMVPSIYVTCRLTARCLDHRLLDPKATKVMSVWTSKNHKPEVMKSLRDTEIVDTLSLTLGHLWIGIIFFFYQGNSNSLASVDLSAGYVGLREYSPVAVAARMGLHAYAGPALAGASLFSLLSIQAANWQKYRQSIWRASNILAFQRVYAVAVYSVVATFFRHHLFVWTVFSPKLLYDFVATAFAVQALLTIVLIIGLANLTNYLAKCIHTIWR